jgi:thiamine biosynthesis lipoprotein
VLVVSDEPEQGRQAIAAVLREFDRLHRAYHAWQDSELTAHLNAAMADGKPLDVKPELAAFVREAQALSKQGDYLFDPGIGRLIKLWGFQADEFKAELPPVCARSRPGWPAGRRLPTLAIDGNTVNSRNRHVALDFGGYLKGVALDRAAAILRAHGHPQCADQHRRQHHGARQQAGQSLAGRHPAPAPGRDRWPR